MHPLEVHSKTVTTKTSPIAASIIITMAGMISQTILI